MDEVVREDRLVQRSRISQRLFASGHEEFVTQGHPEVPGRARGRTRTIPSAIGLEGPLRADLDLV